VVGIGYDNFRGVGKYVHVVFNDFPYTKTIITAKDRVEFNSEVFALLNKNIITPIVPTANNSLARKLRFAFARAVYYLQAPSYFPLRRFVARVTKNTVFYDSVLFAVLLFTYPLFLLIIFLMLYQLSLPLPIILITLVTIPLISKFASK
jgi:hypothetical protein